MIEWAKFKVSDEVEVKRDVFADKKGWDMNASLAKAM